MQGFEKLLDIVRKNNPDLISEEAAQQMLDDYKTYEDGLKKDSFEDGKAKGFKEGFDEGREAGVATLQQQTDELVAQMDQDAADKLAAIVKMLKDDFAKQEEDHAEKLQEIYDLCCKKCENMVPVEEVEAMDKDHAEKLQTAMEAIDRDHAKKLEDAIKRVDADHARKFQIALEAIDKSHTDKMQTIYESVKSKANSEFKSSMAKQNRAYDNLLKENAQLSNTLKAERSQKLSILSEQVEKYLNYALNQSIPTKQIVSEAKYTASQKALDKISSILKINNIIQESKDGIFQDYELKLNEAKSAQNKLMVENAELKDRLQKKEAKIMLESKIARCTPAEASFLRSYFENAKSPKVIEEQINDARAAYGRLHAEKRAEVVNSVKTASAVPSRLVNESKRPINTAVKKEEPAKKVVTESRETKPSVNNNVNPYMAAYVEMLKKN